MSYIEDGGLCEADWGESFRECVLHVCVTIYHLSLLLSAFGTPLCYHHVPPYLLSYALV